MFLIFSSKRLKEQSFFSTVGHVIQAKSLLFLWEKLINKQEVVCNTPSPPFKRLLDLCHSGAECPGSGSALSPIAGNVAKRDHFLSAHLVSFGFSLTIPSL